MYTKQKKKIMQKYLDNVERHVRRGRGVEQCRPLYQKYMVRNQDNKLLPHKMLIISYKVM